MISFECIASGTKIFRGSSLKVFCKKGALKNFAKLIGKHLCQSLFFNKVKSLRPANYIKEKLSPRFFPVNFGKFLRKLIFIEHLWWLLLNITENIFAHTFNSFLRAMNLKFYKQQPISYFHFLFFSQLHLLFSFLMFLLLLVCDLIISNYFKYNVCRFS